MQFYVDEKQLAALQKNSLRYEWLKKQPNQWILDYMRDQSRKKRLGLKMTRLDDAIDREMSKLHA